MPMSPYDASQVLSGLISRGGQPALGQADVLKLAALRDQRKAELEDRIRAGDPAAAAQLNGPGGVEQDIQEDPSTGAAAQADVAANLATQKSANMAGFDSPQEQAAAARNLETLKVMSPVDVEKAKTAGTLAAGNQQFQNFQALKNLTEPVLPKAPQGSPAQVPAPATQAAPAPPAPSTASRWRSEISMSPSGLSMHSAQVLPPVEKLNTQEKAVKVAADEATSLGDSVLQQLRQAHPDIQSNPTKYTSAMDSVHQATGGMLYRLGNPTSTANTPLQQDIAAVKLAITRAMVGGQARSSPQLLKMVNDATPDIMYSDGENFKRIREAITRIIPLIQANASAPVLPANEVAPEDTSSILP